jgi:hypothetical protein
VVAAARGRQHPAARVSIVAAAQTLSYTIILTLCIREKKEIKPPKYDPVWDAR